MGLLKAARLVRKAASAKQVLPKARIYWRAIRDPRTPFWVKAAVFGAVGYAFSPIDLLPDFVPFAGWLDDLVISPALLALALKAIPKEVMADAERETRAAMKSELLEQAGA